MKEVVVYTTSDCRYCKLLKMWLNDAGISFVEKEVPKGSQERNRLVEIGRRTVPVLEIDGIIVEHEPYNNIPNYLK